MEIIDKYIIDESHLSLEKYTYTKEPNEAVSHHGIEIIPKMIVYKIKFCTTLSYKYCSEGCKHFRCYCKNKDWENGLWDGLLLYSSNELIVKNTYDFIKNNFNDILALNRKKLRNWFDSNKYEYVNSCYNEKLSLVKMHIKMLNNIGLFNRDFYDALKNDFFKRYEKILKLEITYTYDDPCITIITDNKLVEIMYNESDEKTSLQKISLHAIEEVRRLEYYFNDSAHETESRTLWRPYTEYIYPIIQNNDINIESNKDLFDLCRLYELYKSFPNFKSVYCSFTKSEYTPNNKFNEIYDELDEIKDSWDSMTESYAFSF